MRQVLGLCLLLLSSACANDVGVDFDAAVDVPDRCEESSFAVEWYPDHDGDGFGSALGPTVVACAPVANHSLLATDCDDTNSSVNPGNAELCDDIDNDCKGGIDDAVFCGACMCALANAEQVDCFVGPADCTVRVCDSGFLNCDGEQSTGCEANRESEGSCGYCGNVCDPRASCVAGAGLFDCECQAGLSGDGTTCADCAEGYYGTDSVCGPVLTGLTLSSGTLTPALSNDVTAYTAHVSLATQTITLTPTASPDATITINGVSIATGAPWQSPVLDLGDNTIEIVVTQDDQPTRNYTLIVDRNAAQTAYVKPTPNYGAYFGISVAIDGDTMVVGAPSEYSGAVGVNGDPNAPGNGQGAAYVFVRNGATWSQQAYLNPSTLGWSHFGGDVAISGDTVVVGAAGDWSNATGVNGDEIGGSAEDSGAAYVFVRSGTTWSQQAYLKASNTDANDIFGAHVAVSGDTIAVGAPSERSNATGVNGDQTDNSRRGTGAVYVFARVGGSWSQQAYLKPGYLPPPREYNDRPYFGASISLSANTLVVGAPGERSGATGVNGDPTDESAIESGAAYVFVQNEGTWSQQAYLKASNTDPGDGFGGAVAISDNRLVVSAPREGSRASGVDGNQQDNRNPDSGAAYVFERSGGAWSQQAYLKGYNRPGDGFAGGPGGVAISGDVIVVGGYEDSGNTADWQPYATGSAYVFARVESTWSQRAYLLANNSEPNDYFAASVAVSGSTIVIGAYGEDSSAAGIDGDQTDNSLADSGAVYVFE